MATVDDKILCLHGEPAGTSVTKNGTLWVCQQPSSCSEAKKHLYSRAVERFLSTNQARPKCCGVAPGASKTALVLDSRSPYFGRREPSPERNYAKMKVVTNKERKSFGRPYFVCSKKNDRCSYFQWGDECLIKRPLCNHGKPCEFHTVEREGPNYLRGYFCCPRPKNENCKFSVWMEHYVRPYGRRLK